MKYEQAEHCYPHPPIPTVVEAYENAFGREPSLKELIETAINKVSAENGSDTPDFILAEYLSGCLAAYDKAVTAREKWYGRECGNGSAIGAYLQATDHRGALMEIGDTTREDDTK